MESLIEKLRNEIRELARDSMYVKNQVSVSMINSAIESRQKQIKELENRVEEIKSISCRQEDSGAFELAITQLGYRIIDSSWNDEKEVMYYEVQKR